MSICTASETFGRQRCQRQRTFSSARAFCQNRPVPDGPARHADPQPIQQRNGDQQEQQQQGQRMGEVHGSRVGFSPPPL